MTPKQPSEPEVFHMTVPVLGGELLTLVRKDAYDSLEEQLEALQFKCDSLRHELEDAQHMLPGSMARYWEEESKRLRVMLDAVLPEKTTFYVIPGDSEVTELRVIEGPMPGHHIPIQPQEGSNPASEPKEDA